MVTTTQAREAVYERFATNWGVVSLYTFDNEDFEPPVALPWIRVSMRHFTSQQETLGAIGNRRFERGGSVFFQIFTLQDTGLATTDSYIATIRGLFEGVTLLNVGLRFTNAIVTENGPDGKWYQTTVAVNFNYEETR